MTESVIFRIERTQGFTLIEVMVAIAISAAIAAMAYHSLSAAASAADRHLERVEKLAILTLAMSIVERDLKQVISRPITDEIDHVLPAVSSNVKAGALMEFSRSGWKNPLSIPRGNIQRVRYSLEGDKLWRENWVVMDRVKTSRVQRALLFDEVEDIQIRFLDAEGPVSAHSLDRQWRVKWPVKKNGVEPDPYDLPEAIEWLIELKNWGTIRRVYLLPG